MSRNIIKLSNKFIKTNYKLEWREYAFLCVFFWQNTRHTTPQDIYLLGDVLSKIHFFYKWTGARSCVSVGARRRGESLAACYEHFQARVDVTKSGTYYTTHPTSRFWCSRYACRSGGHRCSTESERKKKQIPSPRGDPSPKPQK